MPGCDIPGGIIPFKLEIAATFNGFTTDKVGYRIVSIDGLASKGLVTSANDQQRRRVQMELMCGLFFGKGKPFNNTGYDEADNETNDGRNDCIHQPGEKSTNTTNTGDC